MRSVIIGACFKINFETSNKELYVILSKYQIKYQTCI